MSTQSRERWCWPGQTLSSRGRGVLLHAAIAWRSAPREGEVEELRWFMQVKGTEDGLLAGGGCGALGDAAVGGREVDQVQAVEFVAQVSPGVTGDVLGDADEQQRQPAQLDVGADAVLAVVEHRPQRKASFMPRHPRSTWSSCLQAAARSSGVRVRSEVRSYFGVEDGETAAVTTEQRKLNVVDSRSFAEACSVIVATRLVTRPRSRARHYDVDGKTLLVLSVEAGHAARA